MSKYYSTLFLLMIQRNINRMNNFNFLRLNWRTLLPGFLLLVSAGIASAQSLDTPAQAAQSTAADRIVAVVGKESILQSDLTAQVQFFVFNNHMDPNTPGLQQQVLDGMVNEKLLIAKALEDSNITVSDDEVNAELDQVIQQRVQQAGSEK